jgi:hypothetical protein
MLNAVSEVSFPAHTNRPFGGALLMNLASYQYRCAEREARVQRKEMA